MKIVILYKDGLIQTRNTYVEDREAGERNRRYGMSLHWFVTKPLSFWIPREYGRQLFKGHRDIPLNLAMK
jgi:hypothetical protein